MRTILLFLACLISGMLTAQTIDNPTFKVRTGSTTNITRIERTPEDTEGNTYDISLVPAGKTKKNLLSAVKGNWYKADNSNNWEYGIYDFISILQNGNLLISLNGESEQTYTRQKSTLPVIAPEEDFTEFLKKLALIKHHKNCILQKTILA